MNVYEIKNYGNTRSVYIKGETWEISRNQTITINDDEVENAAEVATAFGKLQYITLDIIKQPDKKVSTSKCKSKTKKQKTSKTKTTKKKKKTPRKKLSALTNKKMKQSKYKRRIKK